MAGRQRQNITAYLYDKKGKLLSIGKNNYIKTHPYQAFHAKKVGLDKKIFIHAEIDAINRCRDISKAHKLVVVRSMKDGTYGNAKPCPICMSAINLTPIKIIEHS